MSEQKLSNRAQIIIALIGLAGIIAGGVFGVLPHFLDNKDPKDLSIVHSRGGGSGADLNTTQDPSPEAGADNPSTRSTESPLETTTDLEPSIPAHCGDGVENGDETRTDCGGSCDPCLIPLGGKGYFVVNGKTLYLVKGSGERIRFGTERWNDVATMAASKNELFMIGGNHLFKIDFANGDHQRLGHEIWSDESSMVYFKSNLYVMSNERFYVVDPDSGEATQLGGVEWQPPTALATLGNDLYAIQNSRIHRVDRMNGNWSQIGGADWAPPFAITGYGNELYALQNKRLHAVNAQNGQYRVLGSADWRTPFQICTCANSMMTIHEDKLYNVSSNGNRSQLGSDTWSDVNAITCIP